MDEQTATIDSPFPPPPPSDRDTPLTPPPGRVPWYRVPIARDPRDGKLGGVIGGVSRAYGFDVRTTRIAVAIATLVLPVIALVYLVAWVLLPPRPEEAVPLQDIVRDRRRLPLMIAIGIVLVVGGVGSFGSWFFFGGFPWGVVLIALGVLLWAAPGLGSRGAASPTGTLDAPLVPETSSPWTRPAADDTQVLGQPGFGYVGPAGFEPGTVSGGPGESGGPAGGSGGFSGSGAYGTSGPDHPPVGPEALRPPRRPRVPVGSVTLLVVLAFIGVASAGDALDWWNVPVVGVIVTSLIVMSAGLALSGLVNRSWADTPLLAVLLTVAVGFIVTAPDLDGGTGQRTVRPLTAVEGGISQELALGELTIDLTAVPLDREPLTVTAEVGFGRLAVIVPDDVTLEIDVEFGAGHAVLEGDEIAAGMRHDVQLLDRPDSGPGTRIIVLDLRVGGGEISVERAAPTELEPRPVTPASTP